MTTNYRIRSGDTLSKIAKQHGVSVETLAKTNKLKDPDKIVAGKALKVPDGFETSNKKTEGKSQTKGGYQVRAGDTLGEIAQKHGTSVNALAKANNLKDPNKIAAGSTLKIPADGFDGRPAPRTPTEKPTQSAPAPKPSPKPTPAETPRTQTPTTQTPTRPAPTQPAPTTSGTNRVWTDPARSNKTYPSRDGVPLYNQGDDDWGAQRLGGKGRFANEGMSKSDIQSRGCAITSCAMAVSALSGQTVTPEMMDNHLDSKRAYDGDNVMFGETGGAVKTNPPIKSKREFGFKVSEIDQQLAAGRPVAVGVDYRQGGNKVGTDHWICITSKNPDGTYNANDPDGDKLINLKLENGKLLSTTKTRTGQPYRFTGDAVTFSGGTPVRRGQGSTQGGGTQPTQASTTKAPQQTGGTRPAPTTTQVKGGAEIGNLSRKWESPSPGHVSTGKGDKGGVSYGSYQLSSTQGTAKEFVDSIKDSHPKIHAALAGKTPGSAEFTRAWERLAVKDPEGFYAAQHEFIDRTHFRPIVKEIEQAVPGINIAGRSKALQAAVWSASVQHRHNADTVFKRAIGNRDVTKMSDEEIIKAVYAERGRKDDKGVLVYFRSSPSLKRGLERRFGAEGEVKDALEMLARERRA
jgi:LysM repeat protein